MATVRRTRITDGTTIYIPADTPIALRNISDRSVELLFILLRPAQVTAYYDELTVKEGLAVKPFTNKGIQNSARSAHRL